MSNNTSHSGLPDGFNEIHRDQLGAAAEHLHDALGRLFDAPEDPNMLQVFVSGGILCTSNGERIRTEAAAGGIVIDRLNVGVTSKDNGASSIVLVQELVVPGQENPIKSKLVHYYQDPVSGEGFTVFGSGLQGGVADEVVAGIVREVVSVEVLVQSAIADKRQAISDWYAATSSIGNTALEHIPSGLRYEVDIDSNTTINSSLVLDVVGADVFCGDAVGLEDPIFDGKGMSVEFDPHSLELTGQIDPVGLTMQTARDALSLDPVLSVSYDFGNRPIRGVTFDNRGYPQQLGEIELTNALRGVVPVVYMVSEALQRQVIESGDSAVADLERYLREQ